MPEFSHAVTDFWGTADGFRLVVDPTLPHDRRVSLLVRPGGVTATVTPAIAELLGAPGSESEFRAALAAAQLALHAPDHLFYFPQTSRPLPTEGRTRRLVHADSEAFARFEDAAPEQDRDDAFVELDHWLVFGTFEDGRLVSVASAYPWGTSALADIGVLTVPEFRGRGLAREVVRELGAAIVAEGYEPQYRCQLDNAGSVAVATSAGLSLFGTWEVISPDGSAAPGE